MTPDRSPSPERYEQQSEAELVLARLAMYDDLRRLWAEEACERRRGEFAGLYREILGVAPEQHEALETEMRRILDGGEGTVASSFELLDHPNFSSAGN